MVEGTNALTEAGDVVSLNETDLDQPVWASLGGAHAHLAQRHGAAVRYLPDVAPFGAVSPGGEASAWDDLAVLLGPAGTAVVIDATPPSKWESVGTVEGIQMVGYSIEPEEHPDVENLVAEDVSEMLDLVRRTRPGPFLQRTIELGVYLGIRRGSRLVAMAGQRLHPARWSEISAVCTDPAYRARGLGSILVRAVGAEICKRGDKPFLHVAAGNVDAIRLYQSLGFVVRRRSIFRLVRAPLVDVTRPVAEGMPL